MVLQLQPSAASSSSGAGMWILRLLEAGEPTLVVPVSSLLHVCMDFTMGHHRQQEEIARCTKARYHFCLVLADRQPPVPLWTPTNAERQAVVGALHALVSSQIPASLSVLRLGMLETRSGRMGAVACLVALVPGRLLVFSAECAPLFVLRLTGVADLPQQRRSLGFEVRHAAGASEFFAGDAEMKRVWFDALSAASCDEKAASVDELWRLIPGSQGAASQGPGRGSSGISTGSSRSLAELSAGGAPSLLSLLCRSSPGVAVCAAYKLRMLHDLEMAHITQHILQAR